MIHQLKLIELFRFQILKTVTILSMANTPQQKKKVSAWCIIPKSKPNHSKTKQKTKNKKQKTKTNTQDSISIFIGYNQPNLTFSHREEKIIKNSLFLPKHNLVQKNHYKVQ